GRPWAASRLLTGFYNTAGGLMSPGGSGQSKPRTKAPERRSIAIGRHFAEIKWGRPRLLADFAPIGRAGMVVTNGGRPHSYAAFTRARDRRCPGLGGRDRHSLSSARTRHLERLSAASMGYRRLSGALVRGLSGPQPLHGIRAISAFRRGFLVLAQSRHPGAGNAVDPADDAARVRPVAAVPADRDRRSPGPRHRAAL